MGSVHRPQTHQTHSFSQTGLRLNAAYLLLSSRHRRCCRGLCQACCAREAPEILDIESLCPRLLCAGSYAIWLALCHLAFSHNNVPMPELANKMLPAGLTRGVACGGGASAMCRHLPAVTTCRIVRAER